MKQINKITLLTHYGIERDTLVKKTYIYFQMLCWTAYNIKAHQKKTKTNGLNICVSIDLYKDSDQKPKEKTPYKTCVM